MINTRHIICNWNILCKKRPNCPYLHSDAPINDKCGHVHRFKKVVAHKKRDFPTQACKYLAGCTMKECKFGHRRLDFVLKTEMKKSNEMCELRYECQDIECSKAHRKAEFQHIPETKECIVCLGTISVNEFGTSKLPCGHNHFHKECILECLKTKNECPCCRAPAKELIEIQKSCKVVKEKAIDRSLLVGNYPQDWDKEVLILYLEEYGEIERVKDSESDSKDKVKTKKAYVTFKTKEGCTKAEKGL